MGRPDPPGPAEYPKLFYGELARRIRNRYRDEPKQAVRVFNEFSGQQKAWLIATQLPFELHITSNLEGMLDAYKPPKYRIEEIAE